MRTFEVTTVVALAMLSSAIIDTVDVSVPRPQRYEEVAPPPPPDFPQSVYEFLVRPEKASAVLTEGVLDLDGRTQAIQKYPCRSESKTVPFRAALRVGALILKVQNETSPPTKCIFHPNIAYTFHRGNERLDVLVCHGCRTAMLALGDRVMTRPMSLVDEAMLGIGLELFPTDSELVRYRDLRGY